MIQQVKKYIIISFAVCFLVLAPYVIGWMTLFNLHIEIKPISLNKPILWAQIASLGFMIYFTIKGAMVVQEYTPDHTEDYQEAERQTDAERDEMYVSNHRTGEITWGNLTPEKINHIKFQINQERYTTSWYDLEQIKKQYKGVQEIVLHINNLQKPWSRKGFDKNRTLTEVGYIN